jgi:hypothetical protein
MSPDEPPPTAPVGPEQLDVIREAVTMALYLSLSLLAVVLALPEGGDPADRTVVRTVLLTSVGLLLAHQVAFRMSSRLVAHGRLDESATTLLGAQLAGGAIITILAVVPLIVGGSAALPVSVGLLVVFVAVVGYLTARSGQVSRARALLYVAGVVIVVLAVLAVKGLVAH